MLARLEVYMSMGDRAAGYLVNHPTEARQLTEACPLTLWPEEAGKIALAILQAPERGTPLLEESIALAAGVSADKVHLVAAGSYGETFDDILAMAGQMATLGFDFAAKRIGESLASGKLDRATAISQLHDIDLNAPSGSANSNQIADELVELLESTEPSMCPTGIIPLDTLTGGNPAHELTVFAGRYGSQKSRITQNRALGAASRGNAVLYVAAEGIRRAVAARMISMITAQIIMARKLSGYPLSARMITGSRTWHRDSRYANLRALFYDALEIWRTLPITIMDASMGARNPDRIRGEITKAIYDRNTKLVIIDHMSEIDFPGNDFDKSMAGAKFMGDIQIIGYTAGLGAHFDIVAQRNEEAVKQAVETDSAGVRGGGYIPAKGDNILIVKSTDREEEGYYEVNIRSAKIREGGGGTNHMRTERSSGLIVSHTNSISKAEDAIEVLGGKVKLMITPAQPSYLDKEKDDIEL